MFISPEGVVTGSVDWAELEDVARRKDAENVTAAGWKAVNVLLKEHGREVTEAEEQAKEAAEAAETANTEAGAGPVATAFVQQEEATSSSPSSASSSGPSSESKAPAKKATAKKSAAREIK